MTTDEPGRALRRALLTLNIATAELAGQAVRLHVPFYSVYGEGVVPLLVGGEDTRGFYVDVAPWTAAAREECARWLALLRTSDREDLRIEIRSDGPVPEDLAFVARRSPRTEFELLGLLHVRLPADAAFAAGNAATLRRLAAEYLDRDLRHGLAGLVDLDRLVLEVLRADGHVLPSTLLLLGSMLGDTLVRGLGARWDLREVASNRVAVVRDSAAGPLTVDVFGKVARLIKNGIEDSTFAMARSLEAGRTS